MARNASGRGPQVPFDEALGSLYLTSKTKLGPKGYGKPGYTFVMPYAIEAETELVVAIAKGPSQGGAGQNNQTSTVKDWTVTEDVTGKHLRIRLGSHTSSQQPKRTRSLFGTNIPIKFLQKRLPTLSLHRREHCFHRSP